MTADRVETAGLQEADCLGIVERDELGRALEVERVGGTEWKAAVGDADADVTPLAS